jgi:hypothetical protein
LRGSLGDREEQDEKRRDAMAVFHGSGRRIVYRDFASLAGADGATLQPVRVRFARPISDPENKERADMYMTLVAVAVSALAQTPSAGADKTAVMATVTQFTDAFNKADTKSVAALCADQTSIIDEFPPYEWHGAGSCTKWMADYDADARKNGITDGLVTLSKPKHVDITADRAYVVVPADYTYKLKGKAVKQTGSMFTLALQKSTAGWRVTGWSWARN